MRLGLTVIIPCRNEHESIRYVVSEVDDVMFKHDIPGRILVVDNDSKPRLTLEAIVNPRLHRTPQHVHSLSWERLAGALQTGISFVDTTYVVFMSGDGTDRACAIPTFYKKLCEGYDCVFSQRRWPPGAWLTCPLTKYNLSRLGNRLISWFFDWHYTDYTDMFKGFRLSIAEMGLSCKARGFAFPMELCLRVILSGAVYTVVPTAPRSRTGGKSKFRLWHEVPEYLTTLWRCLKFKWKDGK